MRDRQGLCPTRFGAQVSTMVIRHHARHVTAPLCLAALWAVAGLGQRHSLTPADIAQAIEWGQSGRPEAYPLRSAIAQKRRHLAADPDR